MCGIAGFFDFTGLRTRVGSAKKNNNCFQSALESLSKRGPDTGGVWQDHLIWLGHRRLSILDLSHLGTQPMSFKNYVITFNGMIYNYRDIRQALIQKGYSFHTETDTEVLLAGLNGNKIYSLAFKACSLSRLGQGFATSDLGA